MADFTRMRGRRGRSEKKKIISSTQDWISSESKYRKNYNKEMDWGPFLENNNEEIGKIRRRGGEGEITRGHVGVTPRGDGKRLSAGVW